MEQDNVVPGKIMLEIVMLTRAMSLMELTESNFWWTGNNNRLYTKLYDKCDDFNFHMVNFPLL